MGLFHKKTLEERYPPAPEPEPGAPAVRRTGFARLLELLDRDIGDYIRAGGLALAGVLPFMAGMVLAVSGRALLPMVLAGVIGGAIAAPSMCGMADTVLRSMRNDVGWWWQTYKRAWRANTRASLLPGALFGLASAAQIFVLYDIARSPDPGPELLVLFLSVLLTMGMAAWALPMLALMELPFPALLKNSLLFCLGHPLKTLKAVIPQLLYLLLALIWFPLSALILILGSAWVPVLAGCVAVYPVLDAQFGLEQVYAQRREREQSEIRDELDLPPRGQDE